MPSRAIFITILLLSTLFACQKAIDSKDAMYAHIEARPGKLHVEHTEGELVTRISYKPSDLLVSEHLEGAEHPSSILVDSLRSHYGKYDYFMLEMSANGKEIEAYQVANTAAFGGRKNILAFHMNEYVKVTNDAGDDIPLVDFAYQSTFGAAGQTQVLLILEREKVRKNKTIQFELMDFGLGVGIQKFKFQTKYLGEVPKMEFR